MARDNNKPQVVKEKSEYIQNAEVGMLVAFKFRDKVRSGKVAEKPDGYLVILTQNGTPYNVAYKDVLWVKTGDRWPKQIFQMLKGIEQPKAD